jgi:formylglycine-generating enzyme required for sulfatase activity
MHWSLKAALVATLCSGCPITNPVASDAGTDAPPVDAPACQQGQACDCRASSVLPAGTHWVGADYGTGMIGPVHRVTLTRSVWVATYESSAGCYRACVESGACTTPQLTVGPIWPALPDAYWRDPQFADLPIMGLAPEQADAYCAWLGGRLPTNAEWEKLARGEDGREMPWLSAPENPRFPGLPTRERDRALWCEHALGPIECGEDLPAAVDTLAAGRGPYGHHHLVGNALEYVRDGLAAYSASDRVDPLDAPDSENRLVRSLFGYGYQRDAYLFAGPTVGVRCAFDTEPELLAR